MCYLCTDIDLYVVFDKLIKNSQVFNAELN